MRKCEWHCVDLRCDKYATHTEYKDRAFCMDHVNGDAYQVGRIPLDAEILDHLLREEITRDCGRGQAAILDGLCHVLTRVAKRWNEGDL